LKNFTFALRLSSAEPAKKFKLPSKAKIASPCSKSSFRISELGVFSYLISLLTDIQATDKSVATYNFDQLVNQHKSDRYY
jgi:hypothetical protein